MIRLLSYIYPITRKIKSTYNGDIEITWFRGKKLMNTKNANYSYGSLGKILDVGLQNLNITACKNILLLGLGGGNVIKLLNQKYTYKNSITAIEIDKDIIRIAKEEYGILNHNKLDIICTDAYDFIMNNKKIFDLVIIDLFLDDTIPNKFFEIHFWNKLTFAKQILFNASLKEKNENALNTIIQLLEKHHYHIKKLDNVNKTNTLLIASKKK